MPWQMTFVLLLTRILMEGQGYAGALRPARPPIHALQNAKKRGFPSENPPFQIFIANDVGGS
jgi:hypothetical protein